jgi:hypothetical protein
MKILLFLLIHSLLFANFSLAESRLKVGINWEDENFKDLQINATEDPVELQKCLDTGLRQTAIFYFQVCKHRSIWFDPCLKVEASERVLRFDPLSQSYLLDEKSTFKYQVATGQFDAADPAFSAFLSIKGINLQELANHSEEFRLSKRSYASIRVMLACKGEKGDLLGEVSRLLSFGIVKLNEYDTGWVDFRLYQRD